MASSGNDPNIGSARDSEKSNSLEQMYMTLGPVALLAGIYLVIFLVLRRTNRRFYAPRSYIGSLRESERTPALPTGLFNWFGSYWKIPDTHALQHQSLDAFLYLRFLRMTIILTFVGCCITWPVLFPVNITGGGGQRQLDMLSYSNVDNKTTSGKNRYYAHVFTAWAFYGFVMYMVFRESIYYINLRQAFLISPLYSERISSRTVLFTSVPEAYRNERMLRKVFGPSVKNIWITGDAKNLEDLVKERDKTAYKLEKAEVKLIKLANKERAAALKKGATDDSARSTAADTESGSIAARWLPRNKRPSHRLSFIGKKVDTITHCRSELERMIPEVEQAQRAYQAGEGKTIPSVFIEFRSQGEAEAAFQVLAHHQGLHMSPRYIGVTPSDVVWSSLRIPWWQKVIRRYAVVAFITAMIVFWAIPVGIVGVISNVDYLSTISFLTWLQSLPAPVLGLIKGLLPAVALSILMSLVPIVMRICAKLAGEPSHSRVELFTQNAYFAFQVIQVFLVTTMTSAAASIAKQIADNPASVTSILANNLPKASNTYISYFIVQGLTIAIGVLSQVVGFVIFNLVYRYLSGTPRALYQKWANLSAVSWGSTLPVYTNICVIAITYAAIAPLMLGWACLGMSLFYLAWRYNVLFVTDTKIDTRGLIYPRAIRQLMTGVYLAEICMVGLFAASTAFGPMVLMIAFLVFTVLFHISMSSALDPLLYNLPQSLLAEEETRRVDLEAILEKNGGVGNGKAIDGLAAPAPRKGNMFIKFLKPWIYSDYDALRHLVPKPADLGLDMTNLYTPDINRDAYHHPAATSTPPLLWIPRDAAGVSREEIAHTSRVIPITDDACELDENGKLVWDQESARPPLWEERVVY